MEAFALWLLLKGGGKYMFALFLAHRVIGGHLEYTQVPGSLKEQVAEILRQEGAEHLITE